MYKYTHYKIIGPEKNSISGGFRCKIGCTRTGQHYSHAARANKRMQKEFQKSKKNYKGPIFDAMRKYPNRLNWKIEIIATHESMTDEEAYQIEKKLCDIHFGHEEQGGYNAYLGKNRISERSEEHKKRISGKNHRRSISVIDLTTGIKYATITEAAKAKNCSKELMAAHISGRKKSKSLQNFVSC